MIKRQLLRVLPFGLALLAAGPVAAGDAAPTQNQGVEQEVYGTLDVAGQMGIAGWNLRLRRLVLAPGGHTGLHKHADRPAIVRVIEGTLTVHDAGGATVEYGAGQSYPTDKTVEHWEENRGTTPVVLVVADVLKP